MKLPFTPSFAYFSRKKNFGCSIIVCASGNPEGFSEPWPVVEENEVDGVIADIVGEYPVGDEFCELFMRC